MVSNSNQAEGWEVNNGSKELYRGRWVSPLIREAYEYLQAQANTVNPTRLEPQVGREGVTEHQSMLFNSEE